MDVLLDEDVAAAGEGLVLLADDRRRDRVLADRVLGAVDEAGEIAVVEVPEPVHLVDRGDSPAQPRHDQRRQLEAEVEPIGADVEEDVAGSRDRDARPRGDRPERMEPGGARRPEEYVPPIRAERDDTAEPAVEVALADGADESGELAAQRAHDVPTPGARLESCDEKDRVPRRGRSHRLRLHRRGE